MLPVLFCSFILTQKLSLTHHPQAKLHSLQLLSYIKDNYPSPSSQTVLPKKPVSIHYRTPAMGPIPSHVYDPNKVIALQLHMDLQFFVFFLHAATMYMHFREADFHKGSAFLPL